MKQCSVKEDLTGVESKTEAGQRSEQARTLFDELLQTGDALTLQEPRFHNPDLLELLLEESRIRQIEKPGEARRLAYLARQLSNMLPPTKPAYFRAMCLEVNARRLERDLDGAAWLLASVIPILTSGIERAVYCQTMALICWDEGRVDEADALLSRAIHLYAAENAEFEVAHCQAILGLLREEERDLGDPTSSLTSAWVALSPNSPPYLLVRVRLALASLYVEQDEIEIGLQMLHDARELFGLLERQDELLYARWAEARVVGLLGDSESARDLLDSVSQGLESGDFSVALLLDIDRLVLLAEAGDYEALKEALGDLPHGEPDASLISDFGEYLHEGIPNPRKYARFVSSVLRGLFRAARAASTPFPYSLNV